MQKKRISFTYRFIKALVRLCFPVMETVGEEQLPTDEAVLFVGNHAKMNGPIAAELYFPGQHATWCASQMMQLREVPSYAYADFWAKKPLLLRPFYRLLSVLIAPLSVCVFRNAETIPVYHDAKILTTFRETVSCLEAGRHVIIFPEHNEPYDNIVCAFQERFVDVARLYHRRTGKAPLFVPFYITPALGKICFGEPIRFSPDNPLPQERERICRHLMQQTSALAHALPPHRVVPYQNLPRRKYPMNTTEKGA